jgi:hypothetical protein
MTNQWVEDQQQLAVHAIHALPRLQTLIPNNFIIYYDKMSEEELALVVSLLGELVKCWMLMKFNYTLMNITRLLQSCGKTESALKLIGETKSRTPETLADETINPVYVLLRFAEVASPKQPYYALPGIGNTFSHLGSPYWAMKTRNIYAMKLESVLSQ